MSPPTLFIHILYFQFLRAPMRFFRQIFSNEKLSSQCSLIFMDEEITTKTKYNILQGFDCVKGRNRNSRSRRRWIGTSYIM